MDRKKCLPTEVKAARHQEKKRIRLALESEANSANNSGNTSEVESPAMESVSTMEAPSTVVTSSSSSAPTEAKEAESTSLQSEEKSA